MTAQEIGVTLFVFGLYGCMATGMYVILKAINDGLEREWEI